MNKYEIAWSNCFENVEVQVEKRYSDVFDNGAEVLLKLVDKETPMKPIKLKCYRNEEYDACPKCNTNVYLDDHDYYLDRCEECGQRIDWSDEE